MTSGSSGTILPAGTAICRPPHSLLRVQGPPGRTGIDARVRDGEREPLACEGPSRSEDRTVADATAIVSESVEQQGYRAQHNGYKMRLDEAGKPAEHCTNESDV